MEILGIALSVPVAFLACLVYCLILDKIVVRFDLLRRFMWSTALAVLVLFAVELTLLLTIGPVRSRAMIGPGFSVAHVAFFFLGTPALANVLVLWKPRGIVRWYWAVLVCTAFAFGSVLLQYGVSEALYGVDGTGGPYS